MSGRLTAIRAGLVSAAAAGSARVDLAGSAGKAVGIQDHDHAAVTQDGVADIEAGAAQDRRHRLDHDFLGVEHPVDDDAESAGADLGDDDEAVPGCRPAPSPRTPRSDTSGKSRSRSRRTGEVLMVSMRASERSETPTSSITLSCGMAKRCPAASTIRAETMARVSGILIRKVVPAPGNRSQLDGAADALDIGAHHVHADAAAGDAGHLLGGGKARPEDELQDLLLAHAGDGRFAWPGRWLTAFWRMRSTSRPRPSSAMRMKMWPLS